MAGRAARRLEKAGPGLGHTDTEQGSDEKEVQPLGPGFLIQGKGQESTPGLKVPMNLF